MPADYTSTARALALPVSPPPPSATNQSAQLQWSQRPSHSRSQSRSFPARRKTSMKETVVNNAEKLQRYFLNGAQKLTLVQKTLAIIAVLGLLAVGILFLIYNERIFAWLGPIAVKWKRLTGGWLIIWALIFLTAFPPIIGYSTCLTITGFVYGFPEGWFIAASASVAGSLCSFIVSRTILSRFARGLVENDTRFAALSLVLKHDGLKLLCMIRLCPLPYSISNGAMSTFDTVQPLTYALATAIVSPKLMTHIFIGDRLATIAKSGEKMDAATRAINWASIITTGIIGALTGWFIYRRTLARSHQLETEGSRQAHRTTSHDSEFIDDPTEHAATATLLRDDQIDFLDYGDRPERYQDEYTDDENSVFRYGDDRDKDAISLNKQRPMR